jgi:hypothetical protein
MDIPPGWILPESIEKAKEAQAIMQTGSFWKMHFKVVLQSAAWM